MHATASCTVTLGMSAHDVTLRVQDEGPGIDSDAVTHVFDRFHRAHKIGSRAAIAEVHQVRIELDNTHDRACASTWSSRPYGSRSPRPRERTGGRRGRAFPTAIREFRKAGQPPAFGGAGRRRARSRGSPVAGRRG
ncbi:ATP-binding protein [Streptomyces sp. NRRL F-525]|uniref:ATP-binding protein n=1 Tax=Streptomyces sp. NRRL F-525 TaxID=1463861 RepID=UPI003B63B55E